METIKYKGYRIKIVRDCCAQNPFEDWDGNFPTMVLTDRNYLVDYSKGEIDNYLANFLKPSQIKFHQKKLLDLIGYDPGAFKRDYEPGERAEMLADLLGEWLIHSFDNRAEFCELFNIPHLNTCSKGYSQGDHADIFVCYTPQFEKVTGCTDFSESAMQSNVDLWGYWAWGNVYGFAIKNQDGEEIDSCYGFYGDDHEKSGLLDEAKGQIDYQVRKAQKERVNMLKNLIRNRVPYNKRVELIKN